MFGHLIHDFLCGLVFLPRELYDTDFVVVVPPSGRKSAELWLKAFNFSKHLHLIDINNTNNVHVEKLYVISSGQYVHGYTIAGIAKVRSHLFDFYNLSKIVPTEYKIINRPSGNRLIYGIDELITELEKYNNLEEGKKWTVDKYNSDNMSDVVRAFSSIKVLITPQGSGVYNCIFMQPKTGILLFSSREIDGPNCQFAAAGDYFMVSVVHWNNSVYDKGWNCDEKAMAKMANFLVVSVKQGKLIHDPDYIELFPIIYKNIAYEYSPDLPGLL